MRPSPKLRIVLVMLAACVPLAAQVERYELGHRVRDFEIEWDLARPDAAAKKRVVGHLQAAVTAFFTLRVAEVGRELAIARHALRHDTPAEPAWIWAQSIGVRPARALLDVTATELVLEVKSVFAIDAEIPKDARLVVELRDEASNDSVAWLEHKSCTVPATMKLPLDPKQIGEREHFLEARVFVGDEVLARTTSRVTFVRQLEPRLSALEKFVADLDASEPTSDGKTLEALAKTLRAMAKGKVQETDYAALTLLADAEALAKPTASEKPWSQSWPAGDHLLRLVADGRVHALRVLVPKGLEKPAPLVLALHGAGGSENMFFQTYGAGAIVRQSRDLGWVLVAPRGGFSGADPDAVVAAIAARVPIDRARVYLVGHSMGAMQAAEAAPRISSLAGVALLGGGGSIRGDWARIPVFVGVGDADFALSGARSTVAALRRAKCARLEVKEYADIEHLAVVAVALPEVFRFFAAAK